MLNGVFDFKRFSKTPLPATPAPILIRGPRGPTGPVGEPYRPQDVFTGPTGITGPTGLMGNAGTFYGQLIQQNLTPLNNQISFGPTFQNVFVNSGHMGQLDLSSSGVFPTTDGTINLGSETAKFKNVFAKKAVIENTSLVIRDQSGNKITMSFDLENYKIIYDVVTTSGQSFKLYSIENINNTLDVNLFPYTGLTFYKSVDPVYNILDTMATEIYTTLVTMDNLEQATTG